GVTGTNGKTTTTYLVRHIFENAPHPIGELGLHFEWHAEHRCNHPHRNMLRVIARRVGHTFVDELVDQRVAQIARACFIFCDGLRGEHRQNQSTMPVMIWWITCDRRRTDRRIRAFDAAFGRWHHQDLARRESFILLGDRHNIVITGRQPRTLISIGVRDRTLRFTNLAITRIRVLHELWIKDVVISCHIFDWFLCVGHDLSIR
ncbi:MAG: hypothetical protein EBU84_20095, partial [Actinobacteria bacterium]|nr:hypothetical protein [Actinomycetota bacterium]